jgi:thiosulfate/3-mercaptopyruvate sulfurtransferase
MGGLSFLVVGAALIAQPTGPAEPPARLVAFDALEHRLGKPDLRLLDARPRLDYDKGHIPGAVWVDAKAVETMAAKPGGLIDHTAWEAWITPLGISAETEVLIYDARRQLDAARLWWILSYLGVPRVGLIDGSFPLWAAEKRPVTSEIPKVKPQWFKVAFRGDRLATRHDVLDALKQGNTRVVDARTEKEHTGDEKRASRGGRIPTACHIEWSRLVDAEGRFLAEPALRATLNKAGVKPGEPVLTHCQGGGRSSVDAFVFERLGFPIRNYYLGWSDWGNADDTPVENGPATKSVQP